MGQYRTHVFVCTSGETCPTQGDVEQFVKHLRAEALKAGLKDDVRINKAGCSPRSAGRARNPSGGPSSAMKRPSRAGHGIAGSR